MPLELRQSMVYEQDSGNFSDSHSESYQFTTNRESQIEKLIQSLPELPEHLKRKQPKRRRNTIKHPKFKVNWTPEEVSKCRS